MFFWSLILCALANETAFEVDDSVYIFHGGTQVRYQKGASKAFDGYPLPIDEEQWPGLEVFRTRIIASLQQNDEHVFMFLSDGRFFRYNTKEKRMQLSPALIDDNTWKGLAPYAKDISAAYRWNDIHSYFFLKDGMVLRYSHEGKTIEEGYPKRIEETIWKSISSSWGNINQIFSWNEDFLFVFFSSGKYVRYNRKTYAVDNGYPKTIDERRWPGMGEWLRTDTRLKRTAWDGSAFLEGSKIAFFLPYHMEDGQCNSVTKPNARFLTAKRQLEASSEYPDDRSAFMVSIVEKTSADAYEKIVLQTSTGQYLRSRAGRLETTKNIDDAEVLFVDKNWGEHVVLLHHKNILTWKNRDKRVDSDTLIPFFFFAEGENVFAKENKTVCGSSLLKLFVVQ